MLRSSESVSRSKTRDYSFRKREPSRRRDILQRVLPFQPRLRFLTAFPQVVVRITNTPLVPSQAAFSDPVLPFR